MNTLKELTLEATLFLVGAVTAVCGTMHHKAVTCGKAPVVAVQAQK